MLLVTRGRFVEATAELERASALDPLSLITKTISGYPFYYARDYARAVERFREVIEMDHNYSMAHFRLGLTYAQEELYDEAIVELGQSVQLSGDRDTIAALGYVYGRSGQLSEARAALAELGVREQKGFVSSYDRVLVYLGLGEAEAALDWLEKAYEERSYWLIYLEVDPALDPLRDHPRFATLRDKVFGPATHAGTPVVAKSSATIIPSWQSSRWLRVLAPVLLLLLIGAGLAFITKRFVWRDARSSNLKPPLPFQNIKLRRITDSGDISDVALSPDGKSVAYATTRNVLWIQNLATGSRLQLFAESEKEERRGLSFSPDGNQLYFYQAFERKKPQLMRIPVLGGPAERVLEDFNTWTALAPDGKRFAFVRWHLERGEQSLIIADGKTERTVISRKIPDYFELWGKTVAWSPDGKLLACIEGQPQNTKTVLSLLIVNAADGSEVRLPNQGRHWNQLYDLTWLPSGNGLLISAREDSSSTNQIWRVSYPEGEWRKVQNDLNNYEKFSVSTDSSRMVAVQATNFSNLWLLPKADLRNARQLTFGNRRTDGWGGLSWTPDGRIVYASNAGGSRQVWIADESGANQKQLTFNNESSTQPFVSPDGHYVVFTAYRDNKPHIWRMDLDGANAMQLTDGQGESWPAITPDGRDVIYTSESSPYATTWSVPIIGGVAPKQLTADYPLGQANPSPDGKLLAAGFYDASSQSPWRLGIFPGTGGQPITSFNRPLVSLPGWTPDSQSVIFVDQNYPYLWQQSIHGGDPVKLLSLVPPERIYNFAFSRDNSLLVIARGRPERDALLIEDIK
jgi:Tol biopolymer transport system component